MKSKGTLIAQLMKDGYQSYASELMRLGYVSFPDNNKRKRGNSRFIVRSLGFELIGNPQAQDIKYF